MKLQNLSLEQKYDSNSTSDSTLQVVKDFVNERIDSRADRLNPGKFELF